MRPSITRAIFATLFFLAGLGGCFYYGAAGKPVMADNQHYFFIAERAASGVPPHISFVDPKNQLSTLMGAAAMRVGRVFGVNDMYSGRALSVVATAGAVALAWLLAFELSGSLLAGHMSAVATLALWGLLHEGSMGMRPKVFVVFFLLLAHLEAARGRQVRAGLAGAATFLCWQPGLAVLGAVGLASLLRRNPIRRLAQVLVGAGVLIGLYEAYFAWYGALGEQLSQAYLMPSKTSVAPINIEGGLGFILREGRPVLGIGRVFPEIFATIALAVSGFALLRPRKAWQVAVAKPGWVAFWISVPVCTAFTIYDHQAYPDLLLLQPYFVVAAGCAGAWLVRQVPSRALWPLRLALAAAGILFFANLAWTSAQRYQTPAAITLDDQIEAGKLAGIYLEQFDSLWAVGCTHLLALNHRDNHVPYGFFFDDTIREVLEKPGWLPLKDGRMPDIILLSRGFYPGGVVWRRKYYDEITPLFFRRQNISVFRRNRIPMPEQKDVG